MLSCVVATILMEVTAKCNMNFVARVKGASLV